MTPERSGRHGRDKRGGLFFAWGSLSLLPRQNRDARIPEGVGGIRSGDPAKGHQTLICQGFLSGWLFLPELKSYPTEGQKRMEHI